MKRQSLQARATRLRKAAGGKQSITLANAAKALGVGQGHAMAVLKKLLLAEMDIPIPEDYEPNMGKTQTSGRTKATGGKQPPPQTEYLTKPFGQPVDSRRQNETGDGFEVDPETVEAVVWPPSARLPKTAKFHRLK